MAGRFFGKWNTRPVDWTPDEVISLLNSWIIKEVDYRSWDYFEACKISNPKLEAVRQRAIDAIYRNSPYLESPGSLGDNLNDKGIELFEELKKQCAEAKS